MGCVSLPPCPPQSLEQSCSCRLLSTRCCPPPPCINTTTFFHDPIPSLGGEPRHPLLQPGPPAYSPGGGGELSFPGLVPPSEESRPLSLHLSSLGALPPPYLHCPREGQCPGGRQAMPVECVWALEGTGWVGQRGNWRCQLGGFLSQGWGCAGVGGVPCAVYQPLNYSTCICMCECVCVSIWDTQARGTLHTLPPLPPLSSLFLPQGCGTLPVVHNPKSASEV